MMSAEAFLILLALLVGYAILAVIWMHPWLLLPITLIVVTWMAAIERTNP